MTFERQNLRLISADIQLARSMLNKLYLVSEDKDLTNRYTCTCKKRLLIRRCKQRNQIPSGTYQMIEYIT